MIGFKYRRKAGDGVSFMGGGLRSSVIFGVMVKNERLRKSSGWTEGDAKVETVCAADLIARSEAVRFDLNDPRRGKDREAAKGLGGVESSGHDL